MDRNDALFEFVQLVLIDIDAGHLISRFCKTGARDQPYITGPDDSDVHSLVRNLRLIDCIGCFHEAIDATTVKALSLELAAQNHPVLRLRRNRVGDLDLTTFARIRLPEDIKNIWREDVTANDG